MNLDNLWDSALVINAQEAKGEKAQDRCVDRAPSTTRGGVGVVVPRTPVNLDHTPLLHPVVLGDPSGRSSTSLSFPALSPLHSLSPVSDDPLRVFSTPHATFAQLHCQQGINILTEAKHREASTPWSTAGSPRRAAKCAGCAASR